MRSLSCCIQTLELPSDSWTVLNTSKLCFGQCLSEMFLRNFDGNMGWKDEPDSTILDADAVIDEVRFGRICSGRGKIDVKVHESNIPDRSGNVLTVFPCFHISLEFSLSETPDNIRRVDRLYHQALALQYPHASLFRKRGNPTKKGVFRDWEGLVSHTTSLVSYLIVDLPLS